MPPTACESTNARGGLRVGSAFRVLHEVQHAHKAISRVDSWDGDYQVLEYLGVLNILHAVAWRCRSSLVACVISGAVRGKTIILSSRRGKH